MHEMTSKTPLARLGEVEDIAAAVLYLASPAGGFVTGKVIEVDGGLQVPEPRPRPARPRRRHRRGDRSMSAVKRVVAWSTGTVGRHAIAGIDARPDLELVGVWVSSDEKDGKDAGELAGPRPRARRDRRPTTRRRCFALKPDCIVHTAMVDDRIFEAIADLPRCLERGHQRGLERAGAAAATRGSRPRRAGRARSTRPARRPAPACTSTASTPAGPTTCCRWR